jgi:hypothetical protein
MILAVFSIFFGFKRYVYRTRFRIFLW